jgi:hypothetical protein
MVFAALAFLLIGAVPVAALSCAEPEPIDWSTRLRASDGAAIGVVEMVEAIGGNGLDGQLALRVRVAEYLHGRAPELLEYATPNFDPWGPYYEVGEEIAILIEDGEVSDGQMNICGPWFSPDDLRQAAADFGGVDDAQTTFLDRVFSLIETLMHLLFGW